MPRPKAKELTDRELEVMRVFWETEDATAAEIRDSLAEQGRDLAYTTVATLIRILGDKGFLKQTNSERPYKYRAIRSFQEVSSNLLKDMVQRVFGGSREQLLIRLLDQKKLNARERKVLKQILEDD